MKVMLRSEKLVANVPKLQSSVTPQLSPVKSAKTVENVWSETVAVAMKPLAVVETLYQTPGEVAAMLH